MNGRTSAISAVREFFTGFRASNRRLWDHWVLRKLLPGELGQEPSDQQPGTAEVARTGETAAATSGWPEEEALLARFRQWLAEVRTEAAAAAGAPELTDGGAEADRVGLVRLVAEFTALRHELKLQTKSARNVEEQTAAAVASLGEAAAQFRSVEAKKVEAAQQAAMPLAEALAGMDEALCRARAMMDAARRRTAEGSHAAFEQQLASLAAGQPGWKRWFCARWHQAVIDAIRREEHDQRGVLDALAQGYDLILARLQKAMAREGIEQIECVGRRVDPNLMTVVEVVDQADRPAGEVVEEVRPGYLWRGKLLRYAEVRAVRGTG